MPMVLTEEQSMLRDAAREFCAANAPIAQLRALRDEDSELGFDDTTWRNMVELGWSGIIIPEEYGGLGFGFTGLGVVMQECGRTLTASPLLATALAATAIVCGGTVEQKAQILTEVASGDRLLALALEESTHHAPYDTATTATPSAANYLVTGRKAFVLDGHVAQTLVVVTRTGGTPGDRDGLTLVLIDTDAPGVTVTRTRMLDSRNAAIIEFDAAPGNLLGDEGSAADILDKSLDAGRVLLSAEMLGGVEECFERTIEYLKVREQFGVAIGSFQALKHRAAEMFCDIELSKSVVLEALSALDDDSPALPQLASLAKARLNDTYHRVSSEGIQMHGGIGMTDEHEIGFFLKRSRVCEQALGNSAFHRDRFGAVQGY